MRKAILLSILLFGGSFKMLTALEDFSTTINQEQQLDLFATDYLNKNLCTEREGHSRGPTGPKGFRGEQGPQGVPGPSNPGSGVVGAIGATGATGLTGIALTGNFASLRITRSRSLAAGTNIAFASRILNQNNSVQPLLVRGNVTYNPSSRTVEVSPGNYKITYGVAAAANQAVGIAVDGEIVLGSVVSSPLNAQIVSNSIIVYVNNTISLQAVSDLDLIQNNKNVLAFLEVIQLDSTTQAL